MVEVCSKRVVRRMWELGSADGVLCGMAACGLALGGSFM